MSLSKGKTQKSKVTKKEKQKKGTAVAHPIASYKKLRENIFRILIRIRKISILSDNKFY